MALTHSPKIVRDGLVLHLDAANVRKDLSGLGYNFTQFGSPSFNSNGWWEFRNVDGDGDFEYFRNTGFSEDVLKSSTTTGQFTLEAWFRPMGAAITNEAIIFGRIGHHGGILQASNTQIRNQIRTDAGVEGQLVQTYDISIGNWYHSILTWNNRTLKMYQNGILVDTDTMSTSYTIFNYSDTILVGGYPNNNYRTYGDISIVRAYTKELSASEIQQNFDATRDRYGI